MIPHSSSELRFSVFLLMQNSGEVLVICYCTRFSFESLKVQKADCVYDESPVQCFYEIECHFDTKLNFPKHGSVIFVKLSIL